MISDRQKNILKCIIEEHVKEADAVSSKLLAKNHGDLDASSATIRNEMAVLENEGYIFQPHTSAGRIPTEKAYKYYINNFLVKTDLPREQKDLLHDVVLDARNKGYSSEKSLAKALAALSNQTVILAFSKDDIYFTGISNFFAKPEFQEEAEEWGLMIDDFDDRFLELFPLIHEFDILIGHDNPLHPACGLVATKYGTEKGLLSILGPMRMDYRYIASLVDYAKQCLG